MLVVHRCNASSHWRYARGRTEGRGAKRECFKLSNSDGLLAMGAQGGRCTTHSEDFDIPVLRNI